MTLKFEKQKKIANEAVDKIFDVYGKVIEDVQTIKALKGEETPWLRERLKSLMLWIQEELPSFEEASVEEVKTFIQYSKYIIETMENLFGLVTSGEEILEQYKVEIKKVIEDKE